MGGQSGQQTTQQTSTVQLPPWVSNAAQQNYGFAQNVAMRPLQQYQGQLIADVSPQTQQAWDLAATSGTAGQPQYQAGEAGYMGILGGQAPSVTAGMLANTDLQPYINPYINSVVQSAMDKLEAQRVQSVMGNADTAAKANAFGGSRQGITDAVTNAQTAIGAGQLSSQLYGQAFDTATKNAMADLDRQLTAARANQDAATTANQQKLAAAAGMTGLGDTAQKNVLQQYSMLQEAGQGEQAYAQSIIDAQKGKFAEAQAYPTEQLNTLLASLGMTPYGKTQTTQGQTTDTYSPDFAQSALGLLSIGAGLFKSDKKAKKDITKRGTDPTSGLPSYSFRYKGQPPNAPKTVGPMAQDVEKQYPAAVTNIGGTKYIKPDQIPGGGGIGMLSAPDQLDTPFGAARKAPDGNHYVQHPKTGKYMRVRQRAYA